MNPLDLLHILLLLLSILFYVLGLVALHKAKKMSQK